MSKFPSHIHIKKREMAVQHDDEQSLDLLRSQAHIWNHIYSFINPMSLKCAILLQIPDIINGHGAPMLLSELVEALSMNKEKTQFVFRLMRILVHSGFFVKQSISTTGEDDDGDEETQGYLLAPASHFLLKEEPLSSRSLVLALLDPVLMDPFQYMSEWFQNDDLNPFHTAHGSQYWDFQGQVPKHKQFFHEAMDCDSRLVMDVVLKHCTDAFKTINSIVDVGGGAGIVAKAIGEAFPDISCINFDLPNVVNGLVGSKNVSYIGGDMFEAIPKADAVLLKWILHDWSDEECKMILTRCKEAIPSKENGGKLIIIDMVVNSKKEDNNLLMTQLYFDMLMMTMLSGRERTEKEWAKLFLDSNFNDYKITQVLGLRSLIEVYP